MVSKLDLDIDDLLQDIGDDQPKGFGRSAAPSKPAPIVPAKKDDGFDDFYDDEPISEANVADIVKSVDSEKMDSKLFGKKDTSAPLYHASSSTSIDFGSTKSSLGGFSDKTVIEKPQSAPGIRSTPAPKATTSAFDDFEVDSLLPVDGPPSKPSSAQGHKKEDADIPSKSASLPLPDSKTGSKQSFDLSSSGEFSGSAYMPSTGPTRGAIGSSKTVSFADDRPPTRVGKKLDSDLGGGDWLELAGGGSSSTGQGGRSSALDEILSASSTTSRRPVTQQSATTLTKVELTKPKSAPGGLDLDSDSYRASQARGPSAGSAYSMMLSEKDDEILPSSSHQKPHVVGTALAAIFDEKEEDEAPPPPSNLHGYGHGANASASSLGTPEVRVTGPTGTAATAASLTQQRSGRPTVGSSILLDPDTDLFGPTGDFNPLRSKRPMSGSIDDAGSAPASAGSIPRQGTPPGGQAALAGFPVMSADGLGADASAVSELSRLVQLHNRESQLAQELTAVRRHMDVNRLYLQRILGSVFGLETNIPQQTGQSDQASTIQTAQATPAQTAPTPKSTVDLTRVQELESEIAHLKVQLNLVESIKMTLQTQHEQELEVIRKSYQRQIDEVEQAGRHKEDRLKANVADLSEELEACRKRHADEISEKSLTHKSEIERLNRQRDDHVRDLQNRHRQEMVELRRAHEEQVEMLRAERRADAAAAGAAPELKQLADHLAELEQNVAQRHENSMSLKMVLFSDREANLRSQEAALAKERDQIKQALVQLEHARNELQQQRWLVEQKEAKVSAMQNSLEEERRRLTEMQERDRQHLDKMRSDMVDEHSKLLQDIFRDRAKLSQESEKVEAEHRKLIGARAELQHLQAMSQQTVAQARQSEERMQAEQAKLLSDREKMLVELRSLDEERAQVGKLRHEIEEQRRQAEHKFKEAEALANKSEQQLEQAEAMRAEFSDLKRQISEKQSMIQEAQGNIVEEQNKLSKERAEIEQLRRTFTCSACNRHVQPAEVQKVVFESSSEFSGIRDHINSLEQRLNNDLMVAERDTMLPSRSATKKSKKQTHYKKKNDDFDYEAEKAWLAQMARFRIQSTQFH